MPPANHLKFSKQGKSLAEISPEIAENWDKEANGALTPAMVSFGSQKKVWWKCPSCGENWEAAVATVVTNHRKGGGVFGCPFCAGKRVSSKNSLGTTHSSMAKEWDAAKNGILTPFDVMAGSNRSVWWRCSLGHSYRSSPHSRTRLATSGCPVCAGKVVIPETSLASLYPEVSLQWHPTKNGNLTPSDVTPGSGKKIWWQCQSGHEWQTAVHTRTSQGSGCPICAGVSTSRMEMRLYCELRSLFPDTLWRNRAFGFELDIYIPSLRIGVEADGSYWHKDKPDKEKEKNAKAEQQGLQLVRVREYPLKKVASWDIECGRSENERTILHRLLESIGGLANSPATTEAINNYKKLGVYSDDEGYRKIAANLPSPPYENSFASQYPNYAADWHYKRNEPLTPEMFMPMSAQKIWWNCSRCGNEYAATIASRSSRGSSCPKCAYLRREENRPPPTVRQSLAEIDPELALSWDKELNGNLTPDDVFRASGKKAWWHCDKCGQSWEASIHSRSKGRGCPYCTGNKVSKQNSLATLRPDVADTWDKELNGILTPEDVTTGSGKKVWWKCPSCSRHWLAEVKTRTKQVSLRCMECYQKSRHSQEAGN